MRNPYAFNILSGHGQSQRQKEPGREREFAIVQLVEANVKQSAITKQFKLSRSAVCKILRNYRERASIVRRKRDDSLS